MPGFLSFICFWLRFSERIFGPLGRGRNQDVQYWHGVPLEWAGLMIYAGTGTISCIMIIILLRDIERVHFDMVRYMVYGSDFGAL